MPVAQSLRRASTVLIVALAVVNQASIGRGQELDQPLRWKFEKGTKLDYNMVQDMTIGSMAGDAPGQNVTMHQELKMTWDVKEVKDDLATIEQKIDKVKMKMTLPAPVGAIEYDSSSDKAPTGPAAMLAPMYKAMTEGVFTITMTPRGEIKDVTIPDEVVEALKKSPGAAAMGDMASAEGFKKMISQGSLVLPEAAPKKGESWDTSVEMNNPAAGKQVVKTTYTFEGTRDVEGKKFAVFKPTIEMKFEGAQVTISEQSSDGEILFNIDEGRLSSSKLEQHVTIAQPGGAQTKIDQNINVDVKPAGEAAGDAKATSEPVAEEEKK